MMYLVSFLQIGRDFCEMLYLLGGMAGDEAQASEYRLVIHLAVKWQSEYFKMLVFVRTHMYLELVRSYTLLIWVHRVNWGLLGRWSLW